MTIQVDWPGTSSTPGGVAYEIYVPKADLTLIQVGPPEIYELDLNAFRLTLRDLEDDEDGRPWTKTHNHNTEVTLGGLTYARLVEIIAPYSVTFEDGQYAVNLVGANSNVGDVANVNQVSVRPQNSAGLISSPAIEYASFNGGVTYDPILGVEGTIYPTGTPRQPSNNLADVMLIATYRGFKKIYCIGDGMINNSGDYTSMEFVGESKTKSELIINNTSDVTKAEFYSAEITGVLDGQCKIVSCLIGQLSYVSGYIEDSILGGGVITLGGGASAHFLNCSSGIPGVDTPEIDMGGSGTSLALRGYEGSVKLSNKNGSDPVSIDMVAGHVILDDTVTEGTIVIRGSYQLTDNSGPNVNVITLGRGAVEQNASLFKADVSGLETSLATQLAIMQKLDALGTGRWKINRTTKQMTYYALDGETPIVTFNLLGETGDPDDEDVFERVPV